MRKNSSAETSLAASIAPHRSSGLLIGVNINGHAPKSDPTMNTATPPSITFAADGRRAPNASIRLANTRAYALTIH